MVGLRVALGSLRDAAGSPPSSGFMVGLRVALGSLRGTAGSPPSSG